MGSLTGLRSLPGPSLRSNHNLKAASAVKVFAPLVQAAQLSLEKIFVEGRPTDRALEGVFKYHRKLGSRDRRFIAEAVYECARWSRRLGAAAAAAGIHREGIRDELLVFGALKDWEFAELSVADRAQLVAAYDALKTAPRAIRESLPDDIDALGARELGARWDKELAALNTQAPVDLRVNLKLTNLKDLGLRLADEDIQTLAVPGFPDALTLQERKNVSTTKTFQDGFFEVQDRSSQKVAPFLKAEGLAFVIDACAGAGGKSLHLASLMQGRGKILSLDISDWKLKELAVRAQRGKFANIETRLIDSPAVIQKLENSADRVLLDVPCSGLGVLRRNPGSKLRLDLAEIEKLRSLQQEILGSYSRMVKTGGYLVYATCSLLPSENLAQVEKFLQNSGGDWDLEEHWSALPSAQNGDGFFAARLVRRA
jgi:16S rRNA (cytosine967-C5)-methyltransferase